MVMRICQFSKSQAWACKRTHLLLQADWQCLWGVVSASNSSNQVETLGVWFRCGLARTLLEKLSGCGLEGAMGRCGAGLLIETAGVPAAYQIEAFCSRRSCSAQTLRLLTQNGADVQLMLMAV
jgi:hypothetical protein